MTTTSGIESTAPSGLAPDPKGYRRLAIRWVALCVVPGLYLAYVIHYGVNSLFLDDWASVLVSDATLHGHLNWALLWHQHNENRFLLPNLTFVLFTVIGHLNTKIILIFSALLMISAYLLLVSLYRRESASQRTLLPLIILGLLWFSPVDYENALWAFQVAWYIILFLFMLMVFALSQKHLAKVPLAVAILAAVGASLSSFQGLLLWPIGLLCLLWRSKRGSLLRSHIAAWTIGATVTCIAYFWHFDFGAATGGTGFAYDFRHFGSLVTYFIADVGNVFPTNTFNPTTLHLHEAIGCCLLAASCLVGVDIIRSRRSHSRSEAFPVAGLLILFGVIFSASVALGTLWYGILAAVHTSRFTMPNILILLGICLYTVSKIQTSASEQQRRRVFHVVTVGVVALSLGTQIVIGTRFGIVNGRQDQADRVVAGIIAVNFQNMPRPTAESLVDEYVFPYYPQFAQLAQTARHDRLAEFGKSEIRNFAHRPLPSPLPPPQEG